MITVYCAYCLRPLARELHRVKVRTETCVRERTPKRVTRPSGGSYLLIDDTCEMQCSTWVMEP